MKRPALLKKLFDTPKTLNISISQSPLPVPVVVRGGRREPYIDITTVGWPTEETDLNRKTGASRKRHLEVAPDILKLAENSGYPDYATEGARPFRQLYLGGIGKSRSELRGKKETLRNSS